jgi:hypothetical protein
VTVSEIFAIDTPDLRAEGFVPAPTGAEVRLVGDGKGRGLALPTLHRGLAAVGGGGGMDMWVDIQDDCQVGVGSTAQGGGSVTLWVLVAGRLAGGAHSARAQVADGPGFTSPRPRLGRGEARDVSS